MKNRILTAVAGVICACAFSISALAQPTLNPVGSLTGDDADGTLTPFGDVYGGAMDTWKKWLFVGSPRETTFRDGADMQDGAVYIYREETPGNFTLSQKLQRPGNAVSFGNRFGAGVEGRKGWLFVAAANDQNFPGLIDPRDNSPTDPSFLFAGQVHIYKLNNSTKMWDFHSTLTTPIPGSHGSFGARTQSTHMALNKKGDLIAIGELNNFEGGVGVLHTYKLKEKNNGTFKWKLKKTISAPNADIDSFGDGLAFIKNKWLVVSANDFINSDLDVQGFAFVYKVNVAKQRVENFPTQTIAGPVTGFADCSSMATNVFGNAGLTVGKKRVALAEPCATGAAGAFAGRVDIYRLDGGAIPLTLEQSFEGSAANQYFGGNSFGSREVLSFNQNGTQLIVGSPTSPVGTLDVTATGADAQVFNFDSMTGWSHVANLTSPTVADWRMLGDTSIITKEGTVLVRESNFLAAPAFGKGQLLQYATPAPPPLP